MTSTLRPKAATLAVGTEVTDGQIVDHNSAWISARLVDAGLQVIEHRAVADDRPAIEHALKELNQKVDLLFVTGGLGPTSDDFTRDLIAEVFGKPLEFDAASWEHVSRQLLSRGVVVREIQRQQCFFPRGARVLTNQAGTANAFTFDTAVAGKTLRVYAMPGPPSEIAAVWKDHIAAEIADLTPAKAREQLKILRFMGRGESQIAEVVEEIIKDSGLRVGYRAHLPYVEVKLWFTQAESSRALDCLAKIEEALKTWLVNRDQEDVTDPLIDWLVRGKNRVKIIDAATAGVLHERLSAKLRSQKAALAIETRYDGQLPTFQAGGPEKALLVRLLADESAGLWRIGVRTVAGQETVLEEKPVFNYKVSSERARKYITERLFLVLSPFLKSEK